VSQSLILPQKSGHWVKPLFSYFLHVTELLKTLEIEGCIVTIDAMGCQKKIAEAVSRSIWSG